MEKHEVADLQRKFYEWVTVAVDEMPKSLKGNSNDRESKQLNDRKEIIYLYLGNMENIWLFIQSKESESPERTKRMLKYSDEIRKRLGKQTLREQNSNARANSGYSIRVQRNWTLSELQEWPSTVRWVKDQFYRLKEIVDDMDKS